MPRNSRGRRLPRYAPRRRGPSGLACGNRIRIRCQRTAARPIAKRTKATSDRAKPAAATFDDHRHQRKGMAAATEESRPAHAGGQVRQQLRLLRARLSGQKMSHESQGQRLKVSPHDPRRHRAAVHARRDASGAFARRDDHLKDNISCTTISRRQHHALADGSTTPPQEAGFADVTCVQNKPASPTPQVRPQPLLPSFRSTKPRSLQLQRDDMRWIEYRPKPRCTSSSHLFPTASWFRLFLRKEHRSSPTTSATSTRPPPAP